MKRFVLPLVVAFFLTGCAHARHVAVVADVAFAQAVFAVDDAETAACQSHVMSEAACTAANPSIIKALQDVKAVTLALQATPKNVAVPKNLPDLLTDLTTAQAIVAPLANAPSAPAQVQTLGAKIQAAILQTIAVVKTFTGGK